MVESVGGDFMIPILYDSAEKNFASNGRGRLRDMVSCTVSEERNGLYECDFRYPVTGAHYNEIKYGFSIGVKHDYSNDVQPFDIVSATKPVNGIVTFHAVHISYRQSKLVTYGTNINSITDAFTMLRNAEPSNPFTYGTNVLGNGYMAAADGEPKSVRALLGGVEGSILDTYGGEYEWNKFSVYLHAARGQQKDFTIRYGVNLLNYNEDIDYSETYSSVIPYWKGMDSGGSPMFVIGDKVDYTGQSITRRGETVPIDLTDKFESQPTKAQVEAMAATYMNEQQPTLPKRNINIDFVRLEDSDEYAQLANLYKCKLCDTVRVVFPMYNMAGYFKIVKTVYNVLTEKYDSIELGALPTTLSQALGLSK